jgi:hypothetical protein
MEFDKYLEATLPDTERTPRETFVEFIKKGHLATKSKFPGRGIPVSIL